MGRYQLLTPDVVRLPLHEGHFLDVKRELTFREYRAMQATGQIFDWDRKEYRPDFQQFGIGVVLAYVVGWSLTDSQGRPLAFSADAFGGLPARTADEILTAIYAHAQAEHARATEADANPTTPSALRAIS